MKIIILLITTLFCNLFSFAQNSIENLSIDIPKGEYSILEVRLNMEDEFRTLEGRDSQGLARISLYTGKNMNSQVLTKGFEGFNSVVTAINEMKKNGWKMNESYVIRGNSLIITHYVFEKVKN